MTAQPSGTVSLVFTDVEGSTRLLEDLGAEAYRQALDQHRQTVREAFGRHDGYEVDYAGDAFFYAFPSAAGAVEAAREVTAALEGGPIRIRVGIHTGEPILEAPKYIGMDVHRAARIMACAHGGQVVLSQTTHDLLDERDGLRDLGEHRLKDLSRPIHLFQVGDAEFPPLRSLYRTNLPVPATPFLGRERELAEVNALLARGDVGLLTLTGPGGTGKTRLALQAAAEASEDFPDGVFWVPLAPLRDPALVLSASAQTLEVKEQPGQALPVTLARVLAGKRLLVVLDNAEHLLPQVATTIATLRDLGGLRLLVTSRERLQLAGEQLYPVPALADGDAAALFDACARRFGADLGAKATVTELCTRLDNLPLAIELAAARTSLLDPEQLLARLGQRLDVLKGSRDADPRQQTLRATIDWSYQLLTAEEQRTYRALSVFAGGCALEAAEQICDTDLDTLQSLIDKSLVRRRETDHGARYWMLETIRQHASEQLGRCDESERVELKHAAWYAREAERRVAERSMYQAWYPTVDLEYENLRAAMHVLGRCNRFAEFCWIVIACKPWWAVRGRLQEASDYLRRALRIDGLVPAQRARLLSAAASIAERRGEAEHSEACARDALDMFRALDEPLWQIDCLEVLGTISSELRGDHKGAVPFLQETLSIAEAVGSAKEIAIQQHELGVALLLSGDRERGRELVEAALEMFEGAANVGGTSMALSSLSLAALLEGDLEAARRLASRSLELSMAIDVTDLTMETLEVCVAIESTGGGLVRAALLLGAVEALRGETTYRGGPTRSLLEQVREQIRLAGLDENVTKGRALSPEAALQIFNGGDVGEPERAGS